MLLSASGSSLCCCSQPPVLLEYAGKNPRLTTHLWTCLYLVITDELLVYSCIVIAASVAYVVVMVNNFSGTIKSKDSPYTTTERRVPELIPVLSSQSTGDVSHKPSGRLPLLSARLAVTLATLKRAATSFTAW